MIEVIIICAVVVILMAKANKAQARKTAAGAKQNQTVAPAPAGAPVAKATGAPVAKPPRKLVIDGTDDFPLSQAGFFAGFGVPVKRMCDARVYKQGGLLEDFPKAVATAVTALYEEGTAMGAEVMRVVHHKRRLEPGEAVYFALTRLGAQSDDYAMFAFVDRTR